MKKLQPGLESSEVCLIFAASYRERQAFIICCLTREMVSWTYGV